MSSIFRNQFNIFLRSNWLNFSDSFSWTYITLSSMKRQFYFCWKFIFAFCIFFFNFVIWFSWEQPGRTIIVLLDFPFQILCLVNFQLLSYCPRCSCQIRLHDSWESKISQMSCESRKWVGLGLARQKVLKVL